MKYSEEKGSSIPALRSAQFNSRITPCTWEHCPNRETKANLLVQPKNVVATTLGGCQQAEMPNLFIQMEFIEEHGNQERWQRISICCLARPLPSSRSSCAIFPKGNYCNRLPGRLQFLVQTKVGEP